MNVSRNARLCRAAISPAGEVSEDAFAEAVAALEPNAAENLPLAGKWASLAALPWRHRGAKCL